jgi:nitroreductase
VEFAEVVASRHSIRQFESRAVEADKLSSLLESVMLAPTAGNLQAYDVHVVRSRAIRDGLARAAHAQGFVAQAPVTLVFCAAPSRSAIRYGSRGETLYCVQDATIACTFAMLAATDLGLASVWVGAFDERTAREVIGAPADQRPVAILPVGYAAEAPQRPPRRPLDAAVRWTD